MPTQVPIDFTPGLLEQYPDFMDCVRASLSNCGRAHKNVAADMDWSPSELTRRLVDDPKDVPFRLRDLPALVRATGDNRPIQWLALAFLADPETAQQRALRDLAALAPMFAALAASAGIVQTSTKGRAR